MASRRPALYSSLFFLSLLALIGFLCFRVLEPFFQAIAWAVVLAVGAHGPWNALLRRWPTRRSLLAAVFTLATAVLVLAPAGILASVLFAQGAEAAGRLVGELKSRHISSVSDLVSLPVVTHALEWVQAKTGVTPDDLVQRASEGIARVSTVLAQKSGSLVVSLLDTLVTFATTLFLLFFLLRDGPSMAATLEDLIPLPAEARSEAIQSLRRMLQAIFRGSLLCSLVQGLTGGLGWGLAGLSSPVLAGALMAVLSLLPIGGTALVWLPGCAYLWLDGHRGAAVFLALWGLVVTSFLADNVLKPILIGGGTSELSTLLVFVGVFGGLASFGLLGLFVGPMALALFASLVDVLRRHAKDARDGEPAPA